MSLYFLLLVATFSPFLLWEDVMELANIALLSAEQTVSSPFQTCTLACSSTGQVIWSAGLASCDSEIQCMYNCLGRKKKQQSSVDGGIHTHTSLPHFPLNNIRTELHPAGPSAPRTFSLCHMWAAQLKWVQLYRCPQNCSLLGQDWPESCFTGKWHHVEIKMSHQQFWQDLQGKKYETVWITPSMLVPGDSLVWHIPLPTHAPALLCHPDKRRGLVSGRYSRTSTCPVLASPNFQRNIIGMAALIAGRRNDGIGDPGTTKTCKERAIRLVWWMLWHHHCSKTCFICVAHVQSHQLKDLSWDFCANLQQLSIEWTQVALSREGSSGVMQLQQPSWTLTHVWLLRCWCNLEMVVNVRQELKQSGQHLLQADGMYGARTKIGFRQARPQNSDPNQTLHPTLVRWQLLMKKRNLH